MATSAGFVHPARLLATFGGRARKRFGQNFLSSPAVVDRIVAAAIDAPGQRVLEVGPGLGVLTGALLAAEAAVTAVEIDRDLHTFLSKRFEGDDALSLILGDASEQDWDELLEGTGWVCAANLPYNVGTGILIDLLRRPHRFSRLVVMLQEEVAKRALAKAGDRARGSLSVYCQARAAVRRVTRVPPGAFHPPPKVRSAVICLDLYPQTHADLDRLTIEERVVRQGFSAPRKMLRKSLTGGFKKPVIERALAEVGIPGTVRPATLTVPQWSALTAALLAPRPGGVAE